MAEFGIGPKTLDCHEVRTLPHEKVPLMSHSRTASAFSARATRSTIWMMVAAMPTAAATRATRPNQAARESGGSGVVRCESLVILEDRPHDHRRANGRRSRLMSSSHALPTSRVNVTRLAITPNSEPIRPTTTIT